MPLTAQNFVVKGPVKSADLLQFYNLFTGVMVDQPVTFSNLMSVGGSQANTAVPFKLYGAPGQTSHLIDLYPDRTSAQPGFGFSAVGTFGWGPGGTAPIDTTLSRIATQGHASDTPGLLISPQLEVNGNILPHGSIIFLSGAAVADGGGGVINVGTHLAVQQNIYVGFDRAQYIREMRGGQMGIDPKLCVHGADAAGAGIGFGDANLQVRSADMADSAGNTLPVFSGQCFSGNWLQFNLMFGNANPGIGWPGKVLEFRFDVDANPSSVGGYMAFQNGKVGIGAGPNYQGQVLQVSGDMYASGRITTGADMMIQGNTLYMGPGGDAFITRSAAGSISTNADWIFEGPHGGVYFVDTNAAVLRYSVPNVGDALSIGGPAVTVSGNLNIMNGNNLTFVTPNDPQGGGQLYRVIAPSTRAASSVGGGEIHMGLRLYVDGDITSGTWVHGIGFISTSDPNAKANATVFSDVNCMGRIRAPLVPIYTYQSTPPISGGYPAPTPNDIGFMATDMYPNSPEFVALDSNSNPVAVTYGNIAALLWGALRNLDSRCQAHGI